MSNAYNTDTYYALQILADVLNTAENSVGTHFYQAIGAILNANGVDINVHRHVEGRGIMENVIRNYSLEKHSLLNNDIIKSEEPSDESSREKAKAHSYSSQDSASEGSTDDESDENSGSE